MGTGSLALHRARFAHRHELTGLLHKTPCSDGVLLGTRKDLLFFKRFVAVRPTKKRREIGNLLLVAPTRGGKGLLAVSQLLTWKHSVIVNDIKGELFAATAGYRATLGDVYVIDPTGYGHCYDPLLEKKTEDALLSATTHLLFQADEGEGRIFTQRATVMLSQLFAAAKLENHAPLPYARHLIRAGLQACAVRLNAVSPELATQFLDVNYKDANWSDRFLLSAWGTVTARMRPLLTETVVRCFTHSDFTAEQIIGGERPVTIYLRWKEQDLLALSPLVRLLWGSLIDELLTSYDSKQGRECQPVLLLVDEAGRSAIPSLADQATTVVGRGISLWVSIQSLSQLETVYGRARAQILKDNMETHLYYPPNDLFTAKHIEEWLGDTSAYAHSTTVKEGEETSEGLTERPLPLLTAQEIRQLKDEEIICFHRRLPPFQIKRMDWRNHEVLKQRHSIPAPEVHPLPQIADLPEQPGGSSSGSPDDFINPDANFEKTM
jgi:type IV secretion system protein VirD4